MNEIRGNMSKRDRELLQEYIAYIGYRATIIVAISALMITIIGAILNPGKVSIEVLMKAGLIALLLVGSWYVIHKLIKRRNDKG